MIKDYIKFPQRKIKKNYRSVTGHFPSLKNGKSIGFESLLEKSYFLSFEFNDDIIFYYEQPQIEIFFKNKNMVYSMDCYVVRGKNLALKDSLVEIKYTEEIEKKQMYFEEKFEATKVLAKNRNLNFELFTEKSLSSIYLNNLDFLYKFKLNPVESEHKNRIFEVLKNSKSMTAYSLSKCISSSLKDYPIIANAIWSLVANNKLRTNLENNKVTMNSLIEAVL